VLVGSTLTILRRAHHNVMFDDPAAFASAILADHAHIRMLPAR
jgi:pimeloyl-ACP methyl ester carboxylesterase